MRKRQVIYLTLSSILLLFSIFSVIGLTVTGVVNDETPPEAVITFDPQTLSIVIFGVDDVDPNVDVTSVIVEEEHDETTIRYTLTDDAGNYLNLTLELKEKKVHVEVEILELNYNGEVFVPEENSYKVYWQPVQPLRHLHQKIHLDDQVKVKTQYHVHKNETRIDIEGERQLKERLVLSGLVIVSLVTDKGCLNYKIEIVDSEPPEIVSVFFETPEYDESAVIRAYVTDVGSGVDFVILSYSADTFDWINLTMNLVDGFYVAEIPPFPYSTTVRFVISAFDRAGNSAVPWEDSYAVTDSRSPTISFVEHSSASPNYNETVTVFAIVTEPINASGVQLVSLNYWNGSVWASVNMTLEDPFYKAVIPRLPYGTIVKYWINAFDYAGNSVASGVFSYTVGDKISPKISVSRSIEAPNYNESVKITANVTDNNGSGVDSVVLRYSLDSVSWINLTMVLTSELYTAEIQAYPYDTVVLYEVYANDTAGNSAVSPPFFYRVVDSYSPEISGLEQSPALPNYDETVTVGVDVTEPPDASGVSFVILSYWDGSAWTNRTMTLVDTRYTATISALPYGTSVQYIVYAFDNAENWKVSEAQFYQVTDSIPPLIGIHPTWNPREPSAEEQVNVSVSVTEPFGASDVKNVTLWYKTDDEWKPVEMTLKGGNWTAIIPGQEADVTVRFYIESYDNAGNRAQTLPYHYTTKARVGWPLAWLAVIVLLIIALTITALYLLYTRRRKKTATKLGNKPIVTLYVPTETVFG